MKNVAMRKTILIYGLALALLTILLKALEYRFFVRDLSLEVYVSVIGMLFAALGVWAGTRLIGRRKPAEPPTIHEDFFVLDEAELKRTGISPREYEVLELMAKGYSNQEIADQLFVSLSTVKTHAANLYMKLDVQRRTQAVRKAKEKRLIA
jgi:two-component system, NarL family, response regulator LiaR